MPKQQASIRTGRLRPLRPHCLLTGQLATLLMALLAALFAAGVRAQIAPVDDPMLAIRERVIANEAAAALTLINGLPAERGNQSEVRYLAARLQERLGRLGEALAALPADKSGLPDAIARDVRVRRALWLARTGRCSEARPLLETLLHETPDTELTMQATECALRARDAKGALGLLREVHGNGEASFGWRFLHARALAANGERDHARRELRTLCIQLPAHARIAEAEAALRVLGEPLRLHDDEHLDRAEHLLEAMRGQAALTELGLLHAPKQKAQHARLLHLRGMALFRSRAHYAEAAKVLAQAAAVGGDTQASDTYHAARALARADRDAAAVQAYRAFAKKYPESRFAIDAERDAAWLELRHDLPGGEAHMRAFLASADKRGDHDGAQSALWELAFYLLEHKLYEQASPLFERYATTSQTTLIRARGLYWAARTAGLAGQREAAIEKLRATVAIEPLHWYALLANARLRELGEPEGDPFGAEKAAANPETPAESAPPAQSQSADASLNNAPNASKHAAPGVAQSLPGCPPSPPAPAILTLPAEVELYSRLGLLADAVHALQQAEPELRKSLAPSDALPLLVHAYHELGEYARPYRLAEREHSDAFRTRPEAAALPLWQALLPRPYAEQVRALTQSERLPADFVYAIMRQESAYDPSVVSSADAVGLLQIIEPTARQLANSLGLRPFKRAMLFVPSTNLRLGAHYLSDLLSRYHGQAVPAIAAYNAGDHRVDAWLSRAQKRGTSIEVDRFVEDIPIEQTRNYVRRVMMHWARYRYLADPHTPWPLALPTTLKR